MGKRRTWKKLKRARKKYNPGIYSNSQLKMLFFVCLSIVFTTWYNSAVGV